MKLITKNFGEIDINENKIIRFENGIIGYPELVQFALIHDIDRGNGAGIRWLQSIEEPEARKRSGRRQRVIKELPEDDRQCCNGW